MGTWRVTTIDNSYSRAYVLDLWGSMNVAFFRDAAVLACVSRISEHQRMITEYVARPIGDEHYELAASEQDRCVMLEAFSRPHVLDRSWREIGEPEVWTLTLQHNECGCSLERTMHLSLRG